MSRKAKINETPMAYMYCLKTFLVTCSWYECSNPENIALTPLAINKMDNTKTDDNNPPLELLPLMFSKIFLKKKSEVWGGKNDSRNSKNSAWKFSTGM